MLGAIPKGRKLAIAFKTIDFPELFGPTKKFSLENGAMYCVSGPMPVEAQRQPLQVDVIVGGLWLGHGRSSSA
jgi:hypothetical protein